VLEWLREVWALLLLPLRMLTLLLLLALRMVDPTVAAAGAANG
jgi:hypothetical protein